MQLSGPIMGRVAALTKHFIEVTKLWEATGMVSFYLFVCILYAPTPYYTYHEHHHPHKPNTRPSPASSGCGSPTP